MSEATNALHPVIYTAARATERHYPYKTIPQYAEKGWDWVGQHPKRVEDAFFMLHGGGELGPSGELWRRLERALERHLERVGRAAKAAAIGYRVEDETFYPKSLVELALPAVWDLEYATSAPMLSDEATSEDMPNLGTHLPPKRISDPAEGNNWLATVVDVRRGFERASLSAIQREALDYRYGELWSIEHISHVMGLPPDALEQQIDAAVRKIQRELGGERPVGCSPSCECGGKF